MLPQQFDFALAKEALDTVAIPGGIMVARRSGDV